MFRILALTENKQTIEEIRSYLEKEVTIEMEVAGDILNFLERFVSRYTQVVILDLDLLDREAEKLVRVLQNIRKELRIILILSQKKMEICSRLLELGMFSYLVKPVAATNAAEIVLSALRVRIRDKR